ncbi:hypothetical protein [Azospirillum isscasi]|uniref:Uncharacterized protein n=1 Tax=Azospirillum isscasi TaxID=3053926 RepID=A0ABU0WCY6_9PROT|nr:hypothetical protein [Azospirillum isscasi]MDQ2102011.1 hypothetical protein [Azospirillum isscasi]
MFKKLKVVGQSQKVGAKQRPRTIHLKFISEECIYHEWTLTGTVVSVLSVSAGCAVSPITFLGGIFILMMVMLAISGQKGEVTMGTNGNLSNFVVGYLASIAATLTLSP